MFLLIFFVALFSIHLLQMMAETTKHSMHKIIMIWLIITIDLRVCTDLKYLRNHFAAGQILLWYRRNWEIIVGLTSF